jgi:hypothetical protein
LIGASRTGVSVSPRWLGAAFCSGKPLFISALGGTGDGNGLPTTLFPALRNNADAIRINADNGFESFMERQRME